ncbi:hypothetical protein EYF80_050667 [Liparis tanakae]|uniref:Uncharacterized protein n=1 Tax=Liparis tanakae TaxID=230148 RepID=A0A4Z2FDV6_9TELE|nr:hypothetical protein EYF80_050667 [Liparis tanakae]
MAADSGLETDNVPVQSLSMTSSLVIRKSKKHFHARGELLLPTPRRDFMEKLEIWRRLQQVVLIPDQLSLGTP